MYKIRISTDAYKKMRCSKNTWEKGTINDFMEAINGWKTTESNLKKLKWRIQLFCGRWNFGEEGWEDWYKQDKNKINYYDNLCGFERTHEICPYGFKQGYFNIDKAINEVKTKGSIRIPFEWVYDLRQYNNNYDGCFMEVVKC